MSSHATLSAASEDRKARLAKLKSLKRKQPDSDPEIDADTSSSSSAVAVAPDVTSTYLSGRNYDASAKGPKLGFESNPSAGQTTLEAQAAALALQTKAEEAVADAEDRPLDLFKLQPKKPNWDLKRDLERKLEVLNVRTENAIARLVKERIEAAQRAAREKRGGREGGEEGEGEVLGLEGATLVEAMHQREREEAEDERRERELEAEDEV